MILKNKGNCSLGDWWGMAKINKKLCFLSKMKKILIFPAESLILSESKYFRSLNAPLLWAPLCGTNNVALQIKLTVETPETVETVETEEMCRLKIWKSIGNYTDNLKARDASASKNLALKLNKAYFHFKRGAQRRLLFRAFSQKSLYFVHAKSLVLLKPFQFFKISANIILCQRVWKRT